LLSRTDHSRQGIFHRPINPLYSLRVPLRSPRPFPSHPLGNRKNLLDLSEFATGQEPPVLSSPGPPTHAIPEIFIEILGKPCEEGVLSARGGPCPAPFNLFQRAPIHRITFRASTAYRRYERHWFFPMLLSITLRAVFSTVRGPRRARRGDCQEPWIGLDGKMRSTPVLETSGRPSLWGTAGPAR